MRYKITTLILVALVVGAFLVAEEGTSPLVFAGTVVAIAPRQSLWWFLGFTVAVSLTLTVFRWLKQKGND